MNFNNSTTIMKLIKFIAIILAPLMYLINTSIFAEGVTIYVPTNVGSEVVQNNNWTIDAEDNKTTWIEVFNLINEYIWYFIWLISFIIVIWWGCLLFFSDWSPDEYKKVNNMLVFGLLGIIISISSYFWVNLIIDLFD